MDDGRSAGARRWHAHDVVPAIRAANRLADPGLVIRKIFERDDATVRLHVIDDLLRDLAFVETVRAPVVNLLERPGEIRLLQRFPGFVVSAAGFAKIAAELGKLVHHSRLRLQRAGQNLIDDETISGQFQCRLDKRFPIQFAVAPGSLPKAAHRAGHTNNQISGAGLFRIDLSCLIQKHSGRRFFGRLFPVVDGRRFALAGEINHHEAAAADVSCARPCHGQRESGRDGGIDGVAALLQNLDTDVGCDGVDGHDRGVGEGDRFGSGLRHTARRLRDPHCRDRQNGDQSNKAAFPQPSFASSESRCSSVRSRRVR